MPGRSEHPRVYGGADPDNRQPAPQEGYRGEQGAAQPLRDDLVREARTPQGEALEVQEQSGVAFAETTGKADGQDPGEQAPSAD